MTTAENRKSELFKVYRFPILLIISIIVGCIVGVVMGPKASMFKPFGDIFLNLLFTTVVPLVFFTISSAVGNMISMRRLGKILGNLLLVTCLMHTIFLSSSLLQSALAGGHRCAAQRPDCAPSGHPLGGRSGHREMAPGSRFPIL